MNPSLRNLVGHLAHAALLLAASSPAILLAATAPQGYRYLDYYHPGTEQVDRQLFENVHIFHLKPGIEEMGHRRYEAALEHFEFILRVYPNQPEVLNLISELCTVRWKSPKCDADQWFELGLARNPNIATSYVVYGIHLQRQRRRPEAIQALDRALEVDPASMNAHYNLGLAYFDEKNYKLANQHAQAAYALGAPLPGLRQKLTKAGKWTPIDDPLAAPSKDKAERRPGG